MTPGGDIREVLLPALEDSPYPTLAALGNTHEAGPWVRVSCPARTPALHVAWGQKMSGCWGHRTSPSLECGDALPWPHRTS